MNHIRWIVLAGLLGNGAAWAAESATTSSGQTGMTSAAKPAAAASPASAAEYDFGDFSSETLATKAWQALEKGEYAAVEAYTGKCISLYESKAEEQSASLTDFAPKEKAFTYWALNDVATSYFILGKAQLAQGKVEEAKKSFNTVIQKFPFAQCWDPQGWFWKVASASSDRLTTIGTSYNFGDYTSQTLTTKAWEALTAKDFKGVELYTKKCIELYEGEAKKQQASLTEFAPKDKAFNYWALNDVATCYFIAGEALMEQKKHKEAKAAFERVVNDFRFAQCWDPKGWFWKVETGSRGRINKLREEFGIS
ncbi:MAG: tetratricopeptide repeat protein [Candidatus Omnitrophica bacterium]|nr:tetratricopeptide repeat protein [Candidatus Omnitrophota bacterium]